jgi:hypothetical protein
LFLSIRRIHSLGWRALDTGNQKHGLNVRRRWHQQSNYEPISSKDFLYDGLNPVSLT